MELAKVHRNPRHRRQQWYIAKQFSGSEAEDKDQ